MTSLPDTKHTPVSTSDSEAATSFKMLRSTFISKFRISRAHYEGIIPKKNIPQCNCVLVVQSYMTHQC